MNTQKRPLVSVIVPVYNVERYLDECLDSIRNQTYERLEIIVVEDCSTDGSLAKLEPHLADPRVRLLQHEQNSGLSAARNTGIEAATGDFVLFVDSDDAITAELVETCIAHAEATGAEVVVFDFTPFQDGDPVPSVPLGQETVQDSEKVTAAEYVKLPHFAWLKFMRRSLLQEKALRFPVGQYYEDWPFHWELAFVASHLERLSIPLYHYRQRGDSITGSGGRKLFHIFEAHQLVIKVVERNMPSLEVRRALATKIHRGTWFVLMTIDGALLREAVARASKHLVATESQRRYGSTGLKAGILIVFFRFPEPLASAGIRCIRAALTRLRSRRLKKNKHRDASVSTAQ